MGGDFYVAPTSGAPVRVSGSDLSASVRSAVGLELAGGGIVGGKGSCLGASAA